MKKYIKSLMFLAVGALAFTACSDEEENAPGNDANPVSTIYAYEAPLPNNPDNDFVVRFVTNNCTDAIYYHVDKSADIANVAESEMIKRVMEKGKQVELLTDSFSNGKYQDLMVTDLYGKNTISVVAVSGDTKLLYKKEVIGLEWEDVCPGTYYFSAKISPVLGVASVATTLQVCTTNDHLYRFKDVFGDGYSMKLDILDLTGSDDDGDYTFFRVPPTATPYTYGDYGAIGVQDIGYWQGDAAFVTEHGYESGMYADHSCFIFVEYYVSAGNLGYGYDFFMPD